MWLSRHVILTFIYASETQKRKCQNILKFQYNNCKILKHWNTRFFSFVLPSGIEKISIDNLRIVSSRKEIKHLHCNHCNAHTIEIEANVVSAYTQTCHILSRRLLDFGHTLQTQVYLFIKVHNLQVDRQSLEIQLGNMQNPAYISVVHVVGKARKRDERDMLVSTSRISGY